MPLRRAAGVRARAARVDRRRPHRVPTEAPVARRPHRARDAAGRVSAPFVRHHSAPASALGHVQRDLRTGRQGPQQATRARARCATTRPLHRARRRPPRRACAPVGCRGPTSFAACSPTTSCSARAAAVAASSRSSPTRRSRAPCSLALDLPREPSAFAPARDPPQVELAWDDPA